MNNRLKLVIFAGTVAGWMFAMSYWLFVEHRMPDPLVWGVPVGAYTTLWPHQGQRRDGDRR